MNNREKILGLMRSEGFFELGYALASQEGLLDDINTISQDIAKSADGYWESTSKYFIKQLFQEQKITLRRAVPAGIGHLKNLRTLDIRSCMRGHDPINLNFPTSIGDLVNLESLYVGIKINSLPASIGNLHRLQKLILTYTNLEYLPDSISRLTKLHYLDISSNRLKSLPDLSKLTKLRTLNMTSNYLDELPEYVYNFEQLNYLRLQGNRIKINEGIGNLKKLKVLFLHVKLCGLPLQELERLLPNCEILNAAC